MAAPPDHFDRNVSVIILNYNHADTTLECLDALELARSPLIREIIVVDNGSIPEDVAILRARRRRSDFVLVEVGINRFFSEGNNIGAGFAHGDYIVFLNNDAFVEPGWIEALADCMRADPTVAAVGPMFLYPDGRIQEVGSVALPTGDIVQVGKGSVWGPDHFDTACTVDFCSAACLMMRRADFVKVGGFGFEWEPAYYEDVDLCLKLWTQCGKVKVNPAARVVHIESKTTSDRALQLQNISEINRARFVEKWGDWLEERQTRHLADLDHTARAERDEVSGTDLELLLGPPARTALPQFVLFSPYPLVPGGGERVMFELAAHLSERVGVENVIFSTPQRYSALRMRQLATTFGFEHVVGTPLPFAEVDPVRCRFAVVLGNSIIPPTRAFGHRSVYQLQFPFWMPDAEVEKRAAWLGEYDEVWVYSDFVRHHVNGLARHYGLDCPPIRVIAPPATWSGATRGLPWADRRTILSVGRFFAGGHNKRQDVVIEAFRELVRGGRDDMELALAGSIHPSAEGRERFHELQRTAKGLRCRFYPNVSRQDLAALYGRSAVLIHAAGYGVDPDEFPETLEHFGITPVEAASFGCIPVVYGQAGPAEVVRSLGLSTVFSTVEECATTVSGLLHDRAGSSALSELLFERSSLYSAEAFRRRVDESMADLGVP